MMRSNKGFSLIELIVAVAILAVAGVAIFGFVVNTSNSYSRTNKEVKLQYEQQLAVNQIRDMIVESDKGIYFDEASKSLALYGAVKIDPSTGDKSYPVTVIHFKQSDGKMYFGTREFASGETVTFAGVTPDKILSENVTEFKVDLTKVNRDKVQFQVTFTVGEREQTATETVALRNRLVVSNTVDTIWGEDADSLDSFIQGITICRGSTKFNTGALDEIGLCGDESVVVHYSAIVTAKAESTREYAVSWSLKNAPEGVSVSADGVVTVAKSVTPSTQFELKATSVDDSTKSTYIVIEVTNSGVYPESVTLSCNSEPIVGNGTHTYTLVPTLTYTNNDKSSEYSLFSWMGLDSLPSGCSFDASTGNLILTSNANGYTFTIVAKANERNSKGEVVLSDPLELKIGADEIPPYNPGPSISIAVSSTVPRGGYVFPTVVFKNATSSTYTYDWWITPYFDSDSTEWDTGEVANSDFDLVSISATGGYEAWNVKHEMQTDVSKRSIALNCAPWLNWSKTFKVVVNATATDKDGNVLKAEPKIISIEPVEVSIEKTDASTIDPSLWNWDNNKPILTDSVLRYEDWYWDGKEKGTEDAKWSPTRRWFTLSFKNLYMTGSNTLGCSLSHNYLFKDQGGTLLVNESVGLPTSHYESTKMVCGFNKQMINWERLAQRPTKMNYSITIKDSYGNSKTSNVEVFSIVYEFWDPTEE